MTHLIRKILFLVATQLEKNMNSLLQSSFDGDPLEAERTWTQKEKDIFFQAMLNVMSF